MTSTVDDRDYTPERALYREMIAATTPEDEVRACARWIDAHVEDGDDWRSRVNPRRLNMTSPKACVLGQAFEHVAPDSISGFDAGLRIIGYDHVWSGPGGRQLLVQIEHMQLHGFSIYALAGSEYTDSWARCVRGEL